MPRTTERFTPSELAAKRFKAPETGHGSPRNFFGGSPIPKMESPLGGTPGQEESSGGVASGAPTVSSYMNYGSYSGADIKVIVHMPTPLEKINGIKREIETIKADLKKDKAALGKMKIKQGETPKEAQARIESLEAKEEAIVEDIANTQAQITNETKLEDYPEGYYDAKQEELVSLAAANKIADQKIIEATSRKEAVDQLIIELEAEPYEGNLTPQVRAESLAAAQIASDEEDSKLNAARLEKAANEAAQEKTRGEIAQFVSLSEATDYTFEENALTGQIEANEETGLLIDEKIDLNTAAQTKQQARVDIAQAAYDADPGNPDLEAQLNRELEEANRIGLEGIALLEQKQDIETATDDMNFDLEAVQEVTSQETIPVSEETKNKTVSDTSELMDGYEFSLEETAELEASPEEMVFTEEEVATSGEEMEITLEETEQISAETPTAVVTEMEITLEEQEQELAKIEAGKADANKSLEAIRPLEVIESDIAVAENTLSELQVDKVYSEEFIASAEANPPPEGESEELKREYADMLAAEKANLENINESIDQTNNEIAALAAEYEGTVPKVAGDNPLLTEPRSLEESIDYNEQRLKDKEDELKVLLEAPNTKTLGELQSISWSIFREKAPVRPLGSVYPRGYTRGPRTIGGTMVFTVFYKHALHELLEANFKVYSSGTTDVDFQQNTPTLPDQLPPLDISLMFANEYGAMSYMGIYGVEFVQEGGTFSIEDIFSENIVQYVARDLDPMTCYALRARNAKGPMDDVWTTSASRMIGDREYTDGISEMEDVYTPENRRNPFI